MAPRTKELGLGLLTSLVYIIGAIFFFGAISSAINRETRVGLIDRWQLYIEVAPIAIALVAGLVRAARGWKTERWSAVGLVLGLASAIVLTGALWLSFRS